MANVILPAPPSEPQQNIDSVELIQNNTREELERVGHYMLVDMSFICTNIDQYSEIKNSPTFKKLVKYSQVFVKIMTAQEGE